MLFALLLFSSIAHFIYSVSKVSQKQIEIYFDLAFQRKIDISPETAGFHGQLLSFKMNPKREGMYFDLPPDCANLFKCL